MTDEIKTEAEKVLTDLKAVESTLVSEEHQTSTYIKTHIAWAIGLGCLLIGYVLGHIKLS